MKKFTMLFLVWNFFTLAFSAVIADETFNYAVGNLAQEASWTTAGTLTTGTGRNIISPALTYSNAGGTYILSGEGKTIHTDVNSAAGYLTTKPLPSTQNSGVIYLTYLFKAGSEQTQTAIEIFGLGTGTSAGPRVYVGKGPGGVDGIWKFGITRSSTTSSDIQWNSQEFTDVDEVILLVIKYEFSGTSSRASFYINPVLAGSEPAEPAAFDNSIGTARTSLNNLWFRANGTSRFNYYVSGARLSTTWAEAVAVKSTAPKLSAPVVGAASLIGAENFTANWTPVAQAIGYTVKVYQGETLIGSFNTDGQSTSSLFVKGLLTTSSYKYSVVAKGDGTNFSDSDESSQSAEFTTLEGLESILTQFDDGTWGFLYDSGNQPAAGAFPSSYHNGFDILSTFLYDITRYDSRGEMHQYGLRMDRQSNGGMVVLPTVKSVEQIEIHAIPGGAPRSFTLKELVAGVWTTVGTYEMTSSTDYKEFIIPLSRTAPAKFRIENAGTGQVTLYQIITRATNPILLPSPVVGAATDITSTGFTAHWATTANATGYKVRVYQGTALVKTVEALGQGVTSVVVSGLEPETQYTYRVLAIGDGFVNYADSYLSLSSEVFATSTPTSINENAIDVRINVINNILYSNISGKLEVYSLQGAKVLQGIMEESFTINLPSGIYILRIVTETGGVYTRKIII